MVRAMAPFYTGGVDQGVPEKQTTHPGGKRKRLTAQQRRIIARKKQFPDEKRDLKCEFCTMRGDKGVMLLRHSGLYNHYFYGCSLYPDCTHAFAATPKGKPLPGVDGRPKPTKPKPKSAEDTKPCSCGARLILRWSHRRESWFYGCARFPRCRQCRSAETFNVWDAVKSEEAPKAPPEKPKKRKKKRKGLWAAVQDDILS